MKSNAKFVLFIFMILYSVTILAEDQSKHCQLISYNAEVAQSANTGQVPDTGWESTELPDYWRNRWPNYNGEVWYRIQWQSGCDDAVTLEETALFIDSISMAGEIYLNGERLWRDRSLQEPLSRSWARANYLLLPRTILRDTRNTLLVRVVGYASQAGGLGVVVLGAPDYVYPQYQRQYWNSQIMPLANLLISATLGFIALTVWFIYKRYVVFGWYALVAFFWVLFAINILAKDSWPFSDSFQVAQANHLAYLFYVVSFCFFTWSLLGVMLSRSIYFFMLVKTGVFFCWVLIVESWDYLLLSGSLITLVFWANCLFIILRSFYHPGNEQRVISACLLLVVIVGIRDALGLLDIYSTRYFYTPYTCLLFLLTAGVVLGRRVAKNAQRIDLFNQELQQAVVLACKNLEATMKVEHQKLLEQSRHQERLQLACNLHDGVGGQLIRSMLTVEQAQTQMDKSQVLSMLKMLRDDLRQTIDQGAGSAVSAPKTVTEWVAPLRQRFGNLMDQLGMTLHWDLPEMWAAQPAADQCIVMARIVEEALTNCLKHSQASSVKVVMEYLDQHQLLLSVIDNGKGFDTKELPETGLHLGLLSMRKRLLTIGGQLVLHSRPGKTCIQARVPLNQNPRAQG